VNSWKRIMDMEQAISGRGREIVRFEDNGGFWCHLNTGVWWAGHVAQGRGEMHKGFGR
jgi:hypothetical protein